MEKREAEKETGGGGDMMKTLEISNFPALDYACAEAMNSLCTNLTFCRTDMKRVMLTSCRGGEGKTFLSMNIARTMAGLGKKVAVLDADLRRSSIEAEYALNFVKSADYGITHYLAGKCEMSEILYLTDIPGFYMVPVGRTVANPLPLLNSARFSRLMEELQKLFDYVLVDAPPIGVVIDAAEIAKSCDGTLFVVKYNEIRRRELQEARQQIERTGCSVLGTALNQISFDSYSIKKYYHKSYYYYSAEPKAQRKRSKQS